MSALGDAMTAAAKAAAARELDARRAAERVKALRKYGEDALLPAGRPDLDVLDYALNEIIGLIRYAEMLEERHKMMLSLMDGQTPATRRSIKEALEFARKLRRQAAALSVEGLAVWRGMKARGLALGAPETR